MIQTANINSVWASLLMEKLARSGLRRIVLSPGSRNTPLVSAAASNQTLVPTVHFDERAAAFYALGLARATRQPVALACTSGTAVANYLPAVVEASMDGIPLLLLTADRPPELQDRGANQTIPQEGMLGSFVRHELDLPCPDIIIPAHELMRQLDLAISPLFGHNRGPVHINCPYREPLAPDDDGVDYREYLHGAEDLLDRKPQIPVRRDPIPQDVIATLREVERGVIVAGNLDRAEEREAVLHLAEHIGWPVLPDIQSGLRVGGEQQSVIYHVDQILLSKMIGTKLRADFILHVGGRVLSKRLLAWLSDHSPIPYVRLAASSRVFDPNRQVQYTAVCDLPSALRSLSEQCDRKDATDWLARWKDFERKTALRIEQFFAAESGTITDPSATAVLVKALQTQTEPPTLWSASSLPIRLLDMYSPGTGKPIEVMANRGTSGIDGTIASAAGYATGSGRPVVLLIGDLAFLHDLTSLELIRRCPTPVTIVVLNNNGGNIFGLLPIAEHKDIFTDYFLTPHGHTFEQAAGQFGVEYQKCDSVPGFKAALATCLGLSRSTIIEAAIPSGSGTSLMRAVAQDVRQILTSSENN